MITKLKYGNTNTFLLRGSSGALLVDTDYAGTLPAFYKALKENAIRVQDIAYVMATHYHPDHMGLIGDLMQLGVPLLLPDVQRAYVHFSDSIFARDGIPFRPVAEAQATVISCAESRAFLSGIALSGEILSTPSHSPDSVSLLLDDGDCFVGDLEPAEYLAAYEANDALQQDWAKISAFHPKRIFYAHIPVPL
jgi:glyoxylase-like metal-dependent hydrolase (beta-lactamase superfamily II)